MCLELERKISSNNHFSGYFVGLEEPFYSNDVNELIVFNVFSSYPG